MGPAGILGDFVQAFGSIDGLLIAVAAGVVVVILVLVFGAARDYALLLIARCREELRRHENRFDAVRIAPRASAVPILASGARVIIGVLCLPSASSTATGGSARWPLSGSPARC